MPIRQQSSKTLSVLEKRLGRGLTNLEALRLAVYARAVRMRRGQQMVYKPRMELWDDGESELITAAFELPGLRPQDIAVDIVDERLVVSGERRQHALGKGTTAPLGREHGGVSQMIDSAVAARPGILQVRELKYGFFRRVVPVPAGCTTSDVNATMENGMLIVSWPRDPQASFEARVEEERAKTDGASEPRQDRVVSLRFAGNSSSRSSL